MSRFLGRKKTKEEQSPVLTAPPIPLPQAPVPAKSNSKSRWGRKKNDEDRKPQLDLATALPSQDDFRTSLIMPGLATRFSMLREQDDPWSLLGKASDDSVLLSNRRSRFMDMGSGLNDIAEVASIREPRPGFLTTESRSPSFGPPSLSANEGYATDDDSIKGSIMSRARPGEGNVLFGGRQKIFKIPIGDAGSVQNLGSNEPRGMRGRALYEDDVHMSAFQKMKERERQAERERRLAELERELDGDGAKNSPSLSHYDDKRDTTSSTNSGPSMISTTGTSVMSHGPASAPATASSPVFPATRSQSPSGPFMNRSNSRRLYEAGLEQNLNEQQSSSRVQRNNSSSQKPSSSFLTQPKSATNLRERYGASGSNNSSRATSPFSPPLEKLTTFDSIRQRNGSVPTPTTGSPRNEVADDVLAQAIDISDRGKATANGTFSRPKKFDENQYMARQKSLLQQKTDPGVSARASEFSSRGSTPRPSIDSYSRGSEEGRPLAPAPLRLSPEKRSRSATLQSEQSLSVKDHMRSSLEDSVDSSAAASSGSSPHQEATTKQSKPQIRLDTRQSDSEREEDLAEVPASLPALSSRPASARGSRPSTAGSTQASAPLAPPPMSEHPALRLDFSPIEPIEEGNENPIPAVPSLRSANGASTTSESRPSSEAEPQSNTKATLSPPAAKESQLGGFVREHLRQFSNASSVYPDETDQSGLDYQVPTVARNSRFMPDPSEYVTTVTVETAAEPTPKAEPAAEPASEHELEPEQEHPVETETPSEPLPLDDLKPSDAAEWMQQLRQQHNRDLHNREPSFETQAEREAFAGEIASRQRAIQENLKIKNGARNPQSTTAPANGAPIRTFGLLRTKSSREQISAQDPAARPIRNMGPGPQPRPGPPPHLMHRPNGVQRDVYGVDPADGPPRTLHSRMPETKRPQTIAREPRGGPRPDQGPPRPMYRPRGPSGSQERPPHPHGRPQPEFARPSADPARPPSSRGRPYPEPMRRPSGPQDGPPAMYRRDFPSQFSSAHSSPKESIDMSNRSRGMSNAGHQPAFSPPIKSAPAAAPSQAFSSPQVTPALGTSLSANGTPALSGAASPAKASPRLSPAETRSQSPFSFEIGRDERSPSSSTAAGSGPFTFPARSADQQSSVFRHRNGRRPTIAKTEISDPQLISATYALDNALDIRSGAGSPIVSPESGSGAANSPSPEKAISPPPMNPLRKGFFGRSSPREASPAAQSGAQQPRAPKQAPPPPPPPPATSSHPGEVDEFVSKLSSGGRLRIRKVSSEDGALGRRRRHEAVAAGIVENEGSMAGGLF